MHNESLYEMRWYQIACLDTVDQSLIYPPNLDKGKKKTYSSMILRLERFVDELLSDDEVPFVLEYSSAKKSYNGSRLTFDHYDLIEDYLTVALWLNPAFIYSEKIMVFVDCCLEMGLMSEEKILKPSKVIKPWLKISKDRFNVLVSNIRSTWKTKNYGAKYEGRKNKAQKRHSVYCGRVDKFFDIYDGLVVVYLRLFYQKEYIDNISADKIAGDLDKLIKRRRSNLMFKALKGYVAKLAFSTEQGFYWHIVFFFDASNQDEVCDRDLAERIGMYWANKITKGIGDYANFNASDDRIFGKCGIGVIRWHDSQLRFQLNNLVLNYFCTIDCLLKPRHTKGTKLIRIAVFR